MFVWVCAVGLGVEYEFANPSSPTMSAAGSSNFETAKDDPSNKLAAATVGLVSKAEFTRRREEIEREATAADEGVPQDSKEKKKKAKKKAKLNTLSFGDDEEAEEESADFVPKRPKLGKNPSVDSSFLPDKERDEAEARRREDLAEEYRKGQEAVKAEVLEVTYSYHTLAPQKDGRKGQRNTVTITKGSTIQDFLNKCREQVRDLRSCSADQLMYVKEDLILPQGLTFYELIVNKARGKSGPLFRFDVRDDVRVGAFDHRVEKEESHPGKVMEKSLYNRNKDKFPYSRFEVYDPTKKYDSYTIHGSEVNGQGVNTMLV